jgi:pentatricopeptide repeat protein
MSPSLLLVGLTIAVALTPSKPPSKPKVRVPAPPGAAARVRVPAPPGAAARVKTPKRPVTDGMGQLRRDAAAGKYREALATITAAEGAIETARDKGDTFFPLPVEAYNLAITACGNGQNHREALGILRRLTMGISPEEGPTNIIARKPRPDAVTFNAAAQACAKARPPQYKEAENVLKQARRFKKLDAILYTSVISACGKAGETKKALSYLQDLREDLGRGDVVAFTAAIDSCARAGDWASAEQVLGQMIFEDRVMPNLRTYRAAARTAAAAGEFDKCEELLDDVREAVAISKGARFWGPRDHAACFEGVVKACKGRGAWREARHVLERFEKEVSIDGLKEDEVEAVERSATAIYTAAIGACARFAYALDGLSALSNARNDDDDAQRRWSAAKDLLDRLDARLKDPSRANRLWRTKRERKQAYTSAMVVAGRAGKADAALKLFDAFEEDDLAPDTACFNAALAACRRSDVETYADFAKKLWRRCVESDDAQPDSLTAAEAVACLERAGRSDDADAIFGEALELGVPLKQARSAGPQGVAKRSVAWLDDNSEYDVSGLSVPLVKCAVRKALRDETASDHTADCVFITGVGAKKLKDPTHVPLRDSVLAFLQKFEPPLDAYVPKDAQGTVVVSRSSLLDRLDYDNEELVDRGG